MLVNVKTTGLWAFFGYQVEYLAKGVQEIKDDKAKHLIDNGRACLVEDTEEELSSATGLIVEAVKKGKAGWWSVKFKGLEKAVKVNGADDEAEAEILAAAKLEVQ